ncbi:hypothetical protein LG299_13770 [Microbacterium lacus]|uniref:hypothetical protein n=1 Tax=Microbacterium lacus TaxID=415217 RepID=UPI00384DE174
MSSGEGAGSQVSPPVALAFATVGYIALLIFGLGMLSLFLEQDVIEAPGLGQVPGITAVVFSTAAFALGLWASVRMPHPSFIGVIWISAATVLAYLAGLWLAAVITGTDLGVATGVVGRIATGWFGVAIVASAAVSGWAAIALVRTRARRPEWPWEREDEE